MDQAFIPAIFMRGGSSKGVFFHARDLPKDRAKQLQRIWTRLYGKPATEADIAKCLAYLDEQTKALTQYHHDIQHPKGVVPNPPQEAMASLCQILCSSNRFLYVE